MDKTPTNNLGSSDNYSIVPVADNDYKQDLLDGSEGVDQEDLSNAVQNNDVHDLDNFPTGYRFVPTDEELVSAYLIPKINGVDLSYLNRIHEVDVYDYSPYELTVNFRAQGENEWYFFTERNRRYPNGKRPQRVTKKMNEPCGYWKATGVDKKVIIDEIHVGSRKTLVYYEGKGQQGKKQPWSMHEFVAIGKSIQADGQNMKLDHCVLSRIYKKSERRNGGNNNQAHARSQLQDQAQPYAQNQVPNQDQTPTQVQAQEVGYGEKKHSQEPIVINSLMEIEYVNNHHNSYGGKGNNDQVQAQAHALDWDQIHDRLQAKLVSYGEGISKKNIPQEPAILSNHMNSENAYNHLNPYGWDLIKEKPLVPFIGSSSSTYDPSQKHNNMSIQHPYNMESGHSYNVHYNPYHSQFNNHISCHNVSPSPSTSLLCTNSDSLQKTPQNPFAFFLHEINRCDNNIGHETEHLEDNILTDMDLESLTMGIIGEEGPSGEDYDFVDDFLIDFCNAMPPPPGVNVQQLSNTPRECGGINTFNNPEIK